MPIPEFILNKLIVPKSLRIHAKGFSFLILNNFAAAVITRFRICVGSVQVPENLISLSLPDGSLLHGTDILPDHPMNLPVGVEIQVVVNNFPSTGAIRINAMTREVGEIEFTITGSEKEKKINPLKPTIFNALQHPKKASLRIDPSSVICTSSPLVMGQSVEHLEKNVYGGIWTSDGSRLREDTLDLINQLNPPIIRYPGRNFSSGYRWEDGIGPKDKRPRRHDIAWQPEETNQVGTDEFLSLCEHLQTEPYLLVDIVSSTPEEAADWVAYCNNPINTEQGSRRSANGHPQPYNVKYWGIGSEMWGAWHLGATPADAYVNRAARFIQAMKQVDPEIKVIAAGNNPLTDAPDDPATVWNQAVLEGLGEMIDFLSWRIYQPEKSGWRDTYDSLTLYRSICAASIDIGNIIDRVASQIDRSSRGKKIMQAIDEWNLWLPPCEPNASMHQVTYTMRDALYTASVLATFFRQGATLGMANIAQLVNVLPLIQTDENRAIATSIFYPFVLFSQMEKNILLSAIDGDHFDCLPLALNMQSHSDVPYLDAIAAISEEGDRISLILVNRYPFNRLTVSIELDTTEKFSPVNAMEIKAPLPETFNTLAKPYRVRITDANLPAVKENSLNITLKPCSIYFVALTR